MTGKRGHGGGSSRHRRHWWKPRDRCGYLPSSRQRPYVHYAGAKAAVDAITLGLSKELAADGIRVNAVAPGVIRTETHADPDRPAKLASQIPMGRPDGPPR